MGRSPCCDEDGVKKGPWTPEEDKKLVDYIQKHSVGSWRALPKHAGLNRCGKSCRLRWTNYLRPDIKRGKFSEEEERLIVRLHSVLGNKWAAMTKHLPGRTDNEIKNYWNTHLRKKLLNAGIDPVTHRPRGDLALLANVFGATNMGSTFGSALQAQASEAAQLVRFQLLQTVVRAIIANTPSNTDLVSLMASATLRGAPSAGDHLPRSGQQFQGPLDGTLGPLVPGVAPDAGGLSGLAAVSYGLNLLGQPGGLPSQADLSSKASSTVDNNGSVDHRTPGSYDNSPMAASTPSLASEPVTMDQLQDMMDAGDVGNSFTAALEPWRDLSEVDSDFCWKDILEYVGQSWPITS